MSRYLSFISYRHKERDRRIAGLLRRGLENWYLPKDTKLDRKNRRIFRDTDELPTSANLGADIENALKESQWLIAVCSEEYVKSMWCQREIEMFIDLGRKDRILPILIGESNEECIPEMIRDIPVIAKIEKNDRNAEKAIAALFARMDEEGEDLGKSAPEKDRAEHYFRAEKNRRLLRYMVIALSAILVILGISVYAILGAARIAGNNEKIKAATEETVKAEELAKEERDRAILMNARMLSMEAWEAIDRGDTDRAIDLALSAIPEDLHGDEPVSDEAVSALRAALSSPDKPIDQWKYTKSFETDFDIKGYMSNYNLTAGLLLLDGNNTVEEHLLSYSDESIIKVEGKSRISAKENGYHMGYLSQAGAPLIEFFYGPDRKLVCRLNEDGYLLEDRYVYADHIYETGSYTMLTWLENPEEGKESPACLINMRKKDVIAALDISGLPVSVSFSSNVKRLAIVDEAGALSFFNTKNGEKTHVLPGKWKSVYYPEASSKFICIDENGKCFLYDAVSFDLIYEIESPSAIKSIQYCSERGIFLALCEDAVRIYENGEGKLLSEIAFHTEKEGECPNYAVFEKYEEYLWGHEGNSFYLIYDRRVDKYELETDIDLTSSDYLPLYQAGLFSTCSKAFYSKDSKYVYRQEYHGELSKWDAKTGEFIWANEEAWTLQGNVHDNAIESIDGEYIWRANSNMDGLEKVDAETGKTVYSVSWQEESDNERNILMPVETSGKIAVAPTQYSDCLIGFDKDTGKYLWKSTEAEVFGFSENEEVLYSFGRRENEKEAQLIRKEISCGDGRVLKEEVLFNIPKEDAEKFSLNYERKRGIVSFMTDVTNMQTTGKKGDESLYYIFTYDAATGEELDRWEVEKGGFVTFSYTGKIGYYWQEMKEEDDTFCRELLPGGKLGEICRLASEEGRKLTTTDYEVVDTNRLHLHEVNDYAYGKFCGDDVVMDFIGLSQTVTITRISDGIVMFNLPSSGIYRGVGLAPDGSGCVIYGYYTNPRIMLASDTDTLVEKARKRQGGKQ